MVVQKLATAGLFCFAAISPSFAFASDDPSQKTIPIDAPIAKKVSINVTDMDENVDRAFNTPTDDGRPGEYFFALGVQAARKGDYKHALAMYKVSASWAYKPADYNLGVMYLNGYGTPVDLPSALAWMALAAERNDAHYVRARQMVYGNLTPEQYTQANEIWRELLAGYGDEHALPRAKARWRETLAGATGSRVGSSAAPVKVGGADGTLNHMNSPNYDMHDGGHTVSSPTELTGGHAADGAVAYQALRITDNPYDPRVMPTNARVTVGDLTQAGKKEGTSAEEKNKDGDSH
jgi:hypothetical protein